MKKEYYIIRTQLLMFTNFFIVLSPQFCPFGKLILRACGCHFALEAYDVFSQEGLLADGVRVGDWEEGEEAP